MIYEMTYDEISSQQEFPAHGLTLVSLTTNEDVLINTSIST
jgi:hypothetical protein